MKLSSDLLSQFAKITKPEKKSKTETIVYGTTVEDNGSIYVKLDGSDLLTPVLATADTNAGERVIVMIKNHTATITGNLTSPAARVEDVKQAESVSSDASAKVSALEKSVDGLSVTVNTHTDEIDNLQKNVQSMTDTISGHTTDITEIKETLEIHTTDITEIKDTLKTYGTDISTIKDTLKTQASDLTTIKADIEVIKAAIEELQGTE